MSVTLTAPAHGRSNTTLTLLRLINGRYLARQWGRVLPSIIGVVLGVNAFVFLPTIAMVLSTSLDLTTSDVSGRAQIEVRAGTNSGIPYDAIPIMQAAAGVRIAAPLVQTGGLVLGSSELLVFFGIDPVLDPQVRTYRVATGDFLSVPGQLLLSERYAAEKKLTVGQSVTLIGAGGPRLLKVVGTLAGEEGPARLNGGDVLFVGLEDAFALRGGWAVDTLSIIPDGDPLALSERLTTIIPAKAVIERPADRLKAAANIQFLLTALIVNVGMIMLGLGSTLIYNTINVSIAQRRAEIGMLRALGTTRRQIRAQFVAEAGLMGVVGSVIGMGVGTLLVGVGNYIILMPQFTSEMVSTQAAMTIPVWVYPLAFAAGVAASMVAGFVASRNAITIDPIEAMTSLSHERYAPRIRWWRVIVAAVLVGLVVLFHVAYDGDIIVGAVIANLGILACFTVMILLFPPVMIALSRVLPGWMYRVAGMTGRLAAENVTRRKRMMSVALLVTIGVGMGATLSQALFGYTDMIDSWTRAQNIGQLTVLGAGRDPFTPSFAIPAATVTRISQLPDVERVVSERIVVLQHDGAAAEIHAVDVAVMQAAGGKFLVNEGDPALYAERLQDAANPAVLIGSNMVSATSSYGVATSLTLTTATGDHAFPVVGNVLLGLGSDRLTVIMDRGVYRRLWADDAVNRLQLVLRPGADVQAVRRALLRDFALSGIVTFDNAEVVAAFRQKTASITNMTLMLALLFVVIIVAGLGSLMIVVVLDRRREIGMLRAVGMRRGQLTRSVVFEAVLMVAIGTLVGVPVAFLITLLQEFAIERLLGMDSSLNIGETGIIIVVALVICTLTAYLPARTAGRTDVLEALRYE